ncbi:hypothetical protein LOAG_12618 [Loa loa]|uniref:Uncharacterized protein n=1 Tax=Loa loa TaxID=7209 RepID=A0A1S0TKZ6_LOALO|nr:hypothetical protein LOAG_12618 [Loa loa]EFO15890.2 hypothetical protein LOAG_12618 [Loa loa]
MLQTKSFVVNLFQSVNQAYMQLSECCKELTGKCRNFVKISSLAIKPIRLECQITPTIKGARINHPEEQLQNPKNSSGQSV